MPINQKGIAHLLMLILLVIGVGIGIYLVQNPAIFNPKASGPGASPDPSLCIASDPDSFGKCLYSARTDPTITRIELTKQIVCTSKTECSNTGSGGGFLLTERNGAALTIYGTPGTNAGIKRINKFDYALLGIGPNVSKVTIKDLIISDDETANCPFTIGAENNNTNCNSTLALGPSISDVVIDNIKVLHSKGHGIEVNNAKNTTIQNSIIYDAGGEGIWFDYGTEPGCKSSYDGSFICPVTDRISKNIKLENNLIADSKVSALAFGAEGTESNLNVIKGNLFVHNHRSSQYVVCPAPDPNKGIKGRHCPGGMFAMSNSKWTVVHDNIIRDGFIDTIKPNDGFDPIGDGSGRQTYEDLDIHATGIELGYQLKNITFINNQIYNNSGVGIFADFTNNECQGTGCTPRDYKIEGVNILQNVLYANRGGNLARKIVVNGNNSAVPNLDAPGFYAGGPTYATYANILNNPNDPNIKPLKKAFIFADPAICNSTAPGQKCKTTLRWYTNDYTNAKVVIKDNPNAVIAQGPNGSQATCGNPNDLNSCWLTDAGITFELRNMSDNSLLASTTAITPFTISSATPSPSPSPSPSSRPVSAPNQPPSLTANPNPCTLPASGKCTTTITWNAPGLSNILLVAEDNGHGNPKGPVVAGQGSTGSTTYQWIDSYGVTFKLYSGGQTNPLASVTVTGTPTSTPTPSPISIAQPPSGTGAISATECSIPYGASNCESNIVWTTSNASAPVTVTIKEANNTPFASGTSGQQKAPWIGKSPLTFELNIGSKIISSATVKATPLISASPNPCTLSNGSCLSTIILNAAGYPDLQIKIKEMGNAPFTGAGANPTGRFEAPWIGGSPLTFSLYSNGTVVDSVVVKGQP